MWFVFPVFLNFCPICSYICSKIAVFKNISNFLLKPLYILIIIASAKSKHLRVHHFLKIRVGMVSILHLPSLPPQIDSWGLKIFNLETAANIHQSFCEVIPRSLNVSYSIISVKVRQYDTKLAFLFQRKKVKDIRITQRHDSIIFFL